MSQLTLILPGLIELLEQKFARNASDFSPAQSKLLGQGACTFVPGQRVEDLLAQALSPDTLHLPWGNARWKAEALNIDLPPGAGWMCLDPVHVRVGRQAVSAMPVEADVCSLDTAQALAAIVAPAFEPWGSVHVASPARWYLRLSAPADSNFLPLPTNRPSVLSDFLPSGASARPWVKAFSDAQIYLAQSPLPAETGQRSGMPISAVWPWGGPGLDRQYAAPAPYCATQDALFAALFEECGLNCEKIATFKDLPLNTPAQWIWLKPDLQAERLSLSLAELEEKWFKPLYRALWKGRYQHIQILLPGPDWGGVLKIQRQDVFKLWRQPLHWTAFCQQGAAFLASSLG